MILKLQEKLNFHQEKQNLYQRKQKSPSRETSFSLTDDISPFRETKLPSIDTETTRETKLPSIDTETTTETKLPTSDAEIKIRETELLLKETKSPSTNNKLPSSDTITPTRETKLSPRETKSLLKEMTPSRETCFTSNDAISSFRETKLPSIAKSPTRVAKSPTRETKSPLRETKSPLRETKSPLRETKSLLRETKSLLRETKSSSSDVISPSRETKLSSNVNKIPIRENEHSPRETKEDTRSAEKQIKFPSQETSVTRGKSKTILKESKSMIAELPKNIVYSDEKEIKSQMSRNISPKNTISKINVLEKSIVTEKQSTSPIKRNSTNIRKVTDNNSLKSKKIPLKNEDEFQYDSSTSFQSTLLKSQTNIEEYYTEFTEEIVSTFPHISVSEALASGIIQSDVCSIMINNNKMLLQKAIEENLISLNTNLSIISKNEVTLSDDQQTKISVELNSAAVQENYKICEENTTKLESWMKDIEDKLADLGVIEEQLPGLQLQISTVKVLKEELENKQNLITTCLDQMRQLAQRGLEVLNKEEINYLQKNLISLRRHYDSLLNQCDRLLKRLTSAYEELQKYKSEVKGLKEWLNDAQREFTMIRSSMGILNKLESKSEHIRSFTSDVIAHQADLRFITMAAQKFITESQEYLKALNTHRTNLPQKLPTIKASESEIKSEVQEITNVFRNFLNEVNRLSDNYVVICSKYRSCVEIAEKAKVWVSDVKKSSKKIIEEAVADEPSAVQDQLDKIKLINMEVVGQGRLVENVFQAVKILTDTVENCNVASVEAKDIENILNNLQEDYSELINSIASRIKELQIALIHSQDIQGGLDRILKWLEETESAMKLHNKPVSLVIEKLEGQIQDCKILKIGY
ncbi:dystonin [Caerostris extrusa]|uniref:Dystonin n=1 Tax=Caerostris extrusa TaxID=172846 RepID=A0AAV4SVF4_CAEEX|nr:dystonin [Caerostris extrusa]